MSKMIIEDITQEEIAKAIKMKILSMSIAEVLQDIKETLTQYYKNCDYEALEELISEYGVE